jgi:16S rRNA (adenine1518-N6/adenine1519-N6)-dimethyltransferase
MSLKIKPLKRFGQNYLVDKNIINKIITTFNPQHDDVIVEIGPGTGSLTRILYEKNIPFTAIEIDTRVINDLKKELPHLEIINKDFLDTDLKKISNSNRRIRLIGNIPYYITSSILFKLFENREIISDALLMVQLEVAKRMTANKSTKDYGILSVLLNYFSTTKICFKISPNVFYPRPKVWSAIVKISFDKKCDESINDNDFIQIVKAAFGNRRKTLKNSLSNSIFGIENIDTNKFPLNRRAEELSIQEFVELTKLLRR